MSDASNHPKIKCASCGKGLVIDPATLLADICCSECGAEIPVDSYPNLSRLKLQMVADKMAREQEEIARKAEAEAIARREKLRRREERRRQEEEKRREREAERERKQTIKAQSARSRKVRWHGFDFGDMQLPKKPKLLGWGPSAAEVIIGLGMAVLIIWAAIIMVAVATGHADAINAMSAAGGISSGLVLLAAGLFWRSLMYAAEGIMSRLQTLIEQGERAEKQRPRGNDEPSSEIGDQLVHSGSGPQELDLPSDREISA